MAYPFNPKTDSASQRRATPNSRPPLSLLAATVMSFWLVGCSDSGSASSGGVGFASQVPSPPPSFDMSTDPRGTNVNLGGTQDFGFFRAQLEQGLVPSVESVDPAGFFAEHHIPLPAPSCGERICLQPMLAVMSNLLDGSTCTMLHLGLNSTLAADPGSRPPLRLSVVVDVSGSMMGEKIEFTRQGLELLIDGMKDDDELALVTYSDAAEVLVPLTRVEDNRVELRSAASSIVADGATNISSGLELGYRALLEDYDSSRQNRVILLSDGVPTAGITGTEQLLDLSRGYNSDGIGLTTIGLGLDFNADLMSGLALQADGNFYFLENAAAVSEVFTEELSFFTVPVAFDLQMSVQAGADYLFGRAVGTPFWQDVEGGGHLDIPSVFLAHRDSDEDVTEDDGRRGGGSSLVVELMPREVNSGEPDSTVALVSLDFREPGTNAVIHDEVRVTYPLAPGEVRREGHFDSENTAAMQKSFVMLNILVGMENAVSNFESGAATSEILPELDGLIASVEDYNAEVEDTDIELDLEMLRALRTNLVQAGVPASTTFVPSDDPWPAD